MAYDVILGRSQGAYPGELVSELQLSEIVTGRSLSSNPPTVLGNAVAFDTASGNFRPIGAADTTASVIGATVRAFPIYSGANWSDQTFGATPSIDPLSELSIAREATIGVQVAGATAPVRFGAVYIQTTAVTGIPVGAYSTTSSADNFQWVGAEWATSGVDANGYGTIRFRVV